MVSLMEMNIPCMPRFDAKSTMYNHTKLNVLRSILKFGLLKGKITKSNELPGRFKTESLYNQMAKSKAQTQ